jgi:hypothetical protein
MAAPERDPAPRVKPAATDDEARQGKPEGVVRYVLGISIGLAVVAMVVIYLATLA